MNTRALIFDLDGTLVNSLPGIEHAVDCALSECRMPPRTRTLAPLIGPPIRQILGCILPAVGETELSEVESSFRRFYDGGSWKKTVPFPSARPTLEALRDAGGRPGARH